MLALLGVKLVRAALLAGAARTSRAQPLRARNRREAFHLRTSLPRARCLTLALAPDGAGPGSHLRFTNVTLGCPLATRARVGRPTTQARHHATGPLQLFHPPGAHESGIESQPLSRAEGWTSRRFAPRPGEPSLPSRFAFSDFPGLTEPPLALGSGQAQATNPLPARQAAARFDPRPRLTHQLGHRRLHFASVSPTSLPRRSGLRPPTGETAREVRAHPKTSGRETSSDQEGRINREPDQLSLHCVARNCPASLRVAHRKMV